MDVTRTDGSELSFQVSHKGPLPHDIVHYFVERAFGLTRAFWGFVESGNDPKAIEQRAAKGGHRSAVRAVVPDSVVIELIQAERLVECFEAEHWSMASDNDAIFAMAQSEWQQSKVPTLVRDDRAVANCRAALRKFAQQWSEIAPGQSLTLNWSVAILTDHY